MASRNEKKLIKLREKHAELTKRIKSDTQERAEIEKEIDMLESAELTSFLKKNGMIVNEDLLQQLAIINRARSIGYTAEDMEQFFELDNIEKTAAVPTSEVNNNEDK